MEATKKERASRTQRVVGLTLLTTGLLRIAVAVMASEPQQVIHGLVVLALGGWLAARAAGGEAGVNGTETGNPFVDGY